MMNKKHFLLLAIMIFLVMIGVLFIWHRSASTDKQAASQAEALYQRNCATCHGLEGNGDGQAAYLLNPKPRKLRGGKFRLVTSQNLQPTRDDIFRTVSNGMPGTGMPAWGHLPESDRRLLADYVLKLNFNGYAEQALKDGMKKRAAEEFAKEMTTPDQPIPIPPEPQLTPTSLEEGRQFYITNCTKCHGENGEGRRDPTWKTAEGYPTWSRNLKEGVFKGGRDGNGLYLRFHTGLPGTPMPSLDIPGDTVWRIVQYIQSLSDPAAQERAAIKPVELVAKRVARLPSAPDDQLWESVPEVRVPLLPIWWINGYVNEVMIKVVHDGHRAAFLLRWNDATHDVGGVRQQSFPDGAAVQFAISPNPPFFAMGAPGEPVYIWHWKALWDRDRNGFQDLAQAFPNMISDEYFGAEKGWNSGPLEDREFLPALQLNNPVARRRKSSIEEANAAGFGTYTAQAPKEQNVEGASIWKDGVWRVSLVRDLISTRGNDVPFSPGEKISVAFAIWNGSAAERNGQKTVSVWNRLTIEK